MTGASKGNRKACCRRYLNGQSKEREKLRKPSGHPARVCPQPGSCRGFSQQPAQTALFLGFLITQKPAKAQAHLLGCFLLPRASGKGVSFPKSWNGTSRRKGLFLRQGGRSAFQLPGTMTEVAPRRTPSCLGALLASTYPVGAAEMITKTPSK